MRFHTTFIPTQEDNNDLLEYEKRGNASSLGIEIAKIIPFERREVFDGEPVYSLDIVAFNHKEWNDLKFGLRNLLKGNIPDNTYQAVAELFNNLEKSRTPAQ